MAVQKCPSLHEVVSNLFPIDITKDAESVIAGIKNINNIERRFKGMAECMPLFTYDCFTAAYSGYIEKESEGLQDLFKKELIARTAIEMAFELKKKTVASKDPSLKALDAEAPKLYAEAASLLLDLEREKASRSSEIKRCRSREVASYWNFAIGKT